MIRHREKGQNPVRLSQYFQSYKYRPHIFNSQTSCWVMRLWIIFTYSCTIFAFSEFNFLLWIFLVAENHGTMLISFTNLQMKETYWTCFLSASLGIIVFLRRFLQTGGKLRWCLLSDVKLTPSNYCILYCRPECQQRLIGDMLSMLSQDCLVLEVRSLALTKYLV